MSSTFAFATGTHGNAVAAVATAQPFMGHVGTGDMGGVIRKAKRI